MADKSGKFTDEWGKAVAKQRYSQPSQSLNQKSEEAPQCPEDKRAADYDNNTPSNWLRGMPSAEGKPNFDHSKDGGK